jgi:hypothetical protein
MTTEPTQTPRIDKAQAECARLGNDFQVWYGYMSEEGRSIEREVALSAQRIAELESQLRTQATEHSLANRRLEDEIGRLRDVIEECEVRFRAYAAIHAINDDSEKAEGDRRMADLCQHALTTAPPAGEKKQRLSEVKAAFAAGKRVQCSAVGEVWRPCVSPPNAWPENWLYRIHPDDDSPPVQTEDKPATVPLAVAEGLAEALEKQCPVSDSLLQLKDSALRTFKASTQA